MFKKIVTELIYSPALSGTLGNCIKRMRNEKSKRQIGLIFVLLAVVVQLFATLFPPESANANNPQVLIDGGVQSIDDYLAYYDQNTKNIRDLLTSQNVSRSDIASSKLSIVPQSPDAVLWTLDNTRQKTGVAYYFQAVGGQRIAHYQPLPVGTVSDPAYIWTSPALDGWFAILKDSGNLVTEKPAPLDCSTAPNPSAPLVVDARKKDRLCTDLLTLSLSARTISPTLSTSLKKASPSDRIVYTVSITNQGEVDLPLVPTIDLADILEYSRILDNGGGEYDFDTKTIDWPQTTLLANSTLERNFTVQLLPVIPSTARGQFTSTSYDCVIDASFGNTLSVPVECPFVKHVEKLTNSLPTLSTKANIISGIFLLLISVYLYLRSAQYLTELYIIRHIHLGGS